MICLKKMLLNLRAPTRERERESKRLRRFVNLLFCFVIAVFLTFAFFLPQFPISLITPVKASTGNWYDTSYKYRRAITVDNSSNASVLTNYQVRVALTSSNFDFSRAQSSGQDIRFTDSDGTTILTYWIETYSTSSQTASIYVKVPSIPASASYTIYIYYGNSTVSTASSLKSTFGQTNSFDQSFTQSSVSPGTTYEAFPAVERLQNGNILVAYRQGSSHTSTDGVIKIAKSTDNGSTWTTTTAVVDGSGIDDRVNLGLKQISNGTIFLPFFKSGAASGTWITKSTDNGSTWSTPAQITSGSLNSFSAPYGKIIELSSGTLLMPGYGSNTGQKSRAVLFQSNDSGSTWTYKSTIAYNGTTDYDETSVINIDDSNLVAVIRYETSPGATLRMVTSTDGGSTWSSPVTTFISSTYTTYGVSPNIIKLSNGHLLLTIGDRWSPNQDNQKPHGIMGYFSTDNGATWGNEFPIYLGKRQEAQSGSGEWHMGYPASIQMPDGTIQTYFYHSVNDTGSATRIDKVTFSESFDYTLADDFEAGNLNLWSTVALTTDISQNITRDGSYSLRINDQDATVLSLADARIFGVRQEQGMVNFWLHPQTAMQFSLNDGEVSGGNTRRFHFNLNSSTGEITYYNGSSYQSFSPQALVTLNQWNKIGLKYNNTTNKTELFVSNISYGLASQWKSGSAPDWVEFNSGSTGGTGNSFYVDDVFAQTFVSTDPSTTVGSENSQISSGITLNNDPTGLSNGKTRITGNANTGNSSYTISDVQYSVNGGGWQGATATDGSFNSSSENFYLDFLPTDNNYNQDGYTIRVKAQSSSGVWQDNLFYFQPFNLDSPANNSFTSNSLPTFGFTINKGEFSILKDNLSKFQVLINKDNKGWQTYIDNIPVDYTSVQNNGDNLQKNSLSTNGNGVYENNKIWVNYSNNNSSIQAYSKAVDSLGNASDKNFEDGGHKLSSGSYQWKVVAVDKSGHSQETDTRKLRVSSKQFNQSQAWFPLTIDFISGIGKLDLSTIHPQDVKDEYFTSYSAPTIKGIANAGTTVTLTKDNGASANTYTATTGTDSHYSITLPVSSLLYGKSYTITLSVKDSGDNYNELPAFKLGLASLASELTKTEEVTGPPTPTPKIEQLNQPTPTPKPAATQKQKHCFLFICW